MVEIIGTAIAYPQNNPKQCIILKYVVPLYLVGIAMLVIIAVISKIPTTPAGTGTARNARHL
jgi:hypothetical protein